MWRNANESRRGALTTPTNRLIADSSSDAPPSSAWVSAPAGSSSRSRATSLSRNGLSWSSESTKTR